MPAPAFRVSGVGKLRKLFEDRKRTAKDASVVVGYTANYAIYVHEMVEANFHRPGSQAKFLEQPAREMSRELANTTGKVVEKGGTIEQGLLIAGLKLQRASQEICPVAPVHGGTLRNSAFTRKE